jgi:serine protease Do
MNDLITKGSVVRGYLGIQPADLTPALQTEFGVTSGAWVEEVEEDSPAGKSGIHAADIITSFDSQSVTGELSLREAISGTTPGKAVPVELLRNQSKVLVTVTIGPPPKSGSDIAPTSVKAVPRKLGLSVRTLTASDRQQGSLGTSLQGALVLGVVPNSPADLSGLQQGDIITQVGRQAITTADDCTKALTVINTGQPATVVVSRSTNGKIQEIALDLRP